MQYEIKEYMALTEESGPQLANRLSGHGVDISYKTLWNWSSDRYKFTVYIETLEVDIWHIVGLIKIERIF